MNLSAYLSVIDLVKLDLWVNPDAAPCVVACMTAMHSDSDFRDCALALHVASRLDEGYGTFWVTRPFSDEYVQIASESTIWKRRVPIENVDVMNKEALSEMLKVYSMEVPQ
jgi:hypothetical protein